MEVFRGRPEAIEQRSVAPPLHLQDTIDEAVAAFGPAGTAEFFCDQQFVVLPTAVLCMATVGDPATQAHIASPSSVVWKPGRIDYAPSDEYPWLPEKVQEVLGPDRERIREHYVFLRLPGDARLLYAGRAHLGRCAGPTFGGLASDREADFSLYEKLPQNEWLRLGGYPGWLVDIGNRSERIDTGDLDTFRRQLAEMAGQEFLHLRMTRFEEDELTVHTNARRGWLLYQRDPSDYSFCGRDPAETRAGEADELFRCGCCGIVLDCPADHTVPRALAIRVAEHFFTAGELPRTLRWLAD